MKLLGLSGALRAQSTNSKLLREGARLFCDAEFAEADLNLPLYDGDLENGSGVPERVNTLARQIGDADGVLISTPEYNKGPSGVLKNALDWISRTDGNPWAGKPVAVMSAAAGRAGGERAQLILRTYMVPFQARVIPGPEVHLAAAADQFDEHGRLISDLYTQTLAQLMANLKAAIDA